MEERTNKELIIDICDDFNLSIKQKAYILATAEHETAGTFNPVKEAFWLTEEWRSENLRYYPYYGRGFVQLTWLENYQKYKRILRDYGIYRDIVKKPDLVLDRDISAFILVHGFVTGSFTGVEISKYINEKKTDYYNARRCINGLDKAERIAELAKKWEATLLLRGSFKRSPVTKEILKKDEQLPQSKVLSLWKKIMSLLRINT